MCLPHLLTESRRLISPPSYGVLFGPILIFASDKPFLTPAEYVDGFVGSLNHGRVPHISLYVTFGPTRAELGVVLPSVVFNNAAKVVNTVVVLAVELVVLFIVVFPFIVVDDVVVVTLILCSISVLTVEVLPSLGVSTISISISLVSVMFLKSLMTLLSSFTVVTTNGTGVVFDSDFVVVDFGMPSVVIEDADELSGVETDVVLCEGVVC